GSHLFAERRTPPLPGWAAAVAVLVVAVVAAVAVDAAERFGEFCDPPPEFARGDFVQAHLVSGTGSGRCQFWGAALDQWREAPLAGQGAGSYEAWWSQNGTIPYFIRDAHSLYLETLGELGVIGFLLLAGALATGLVAGARRLLAAADADEAVAIAAVLSGFLAFLASAAIDWMWEETVVAVVGLLLLGLAVGPATSTAAPALAPAAESPRHSSLRRYGAAIAVLVAGWALVCVQAVPLLTQYTIVASQEAVQDDDLPEALDQALAARQLSPWASSPYLQLALVHEQGDDLPAARAAIGEAIERDPLNWRLWLIRARLETLDGEVAAARESLARAVDLNPRSPLFANAG
ncbi:MAG TPA: O-antigen ligase family protein, partial [Gaiellaceae bacterium]|nr:O-antigen ligase family protein [Gaiellaceae bacterium]